MSQAGCLKKEQIQDFVILASIINKFEISNRFLAGYIQFCPGWSFWKGSMILSQVFASNVSLVNTSQPTTSNLLHTRYEPTGLDLSRHVVNNLELDLREGAFPNS